MTRLRILLITETYPPEINGVAMTTGRLVQGLRARMVWVGDGPILIRKGENGVTVSAADTAAFIAAALTLAGDPALRERLGRRAGGSMQAHGWDAVIERFEAVLREAA